MIARAGNWERLVDAIRKRYDEASDKIVKGSAKSFDQYREDVGYLRALTDINEEMSRIAGTERSPFVERE